MRVVMASEMLTSVAKPLDAATKIKRPELLAFRWHGSAASMSAASIVKSCPAVSWERVDLRLLLRALKLRVDFRACLHGMPAIDYPPRGASPNSDFVLEAGLAQGTTDFPSVEWGRLNRREKS